MIEWLKKYRSIIITVLVCAGFTVYCYGCQPKVESLNSSDRRVGRVELQMELAHIIEIAELRMASLDQQERIRSLLMENALILTRGDPLNPVGLITAIAAIYGISQGGQNITNAVRNKRKKRSLNNG